MSYTSSLLRWLQRKRYQYEVTFSLYMLTPAEKFIFSTPQLRLSLLFSPYLPCKRTIISSTTDPFCRLQIRSSSSSSP